MKMFVAAPLMGSHPVEERKKRTCISAHADAGLCGAATATAPRQISFGEGRGVS